MIIAVTFFSPANLRGELQWTTAVVHALLYDSGRMQPNYGAHVIKVRKIVIVLISLVYHQIQQPIPELRIINFHNFLTNND